MDTLGYIRIMMTILSCVFRYVRNFDINAKLEFGPLIIIFNAPCDIIEVRGVTIVSPARKVG